jgi:hypothetical protein
MWEPFLFSDVSDSLELPVPVDDRVNALEPTTRGLAHFRRNKKLSLERRAPRLEFTSIKEVL